MSQPTKTKNYENSTVKQGQFSAQSRGLRTSLRRREGKVSGAATRRCRFLRHVVRVVQEMLGNATHGGLKGDDVAYELAGIDDRMCF